MKLEYLNTSAIKKVARKNDHRTTTGFFVELDKRLALILTNALHFAGKGQTLRAEHVTQAIADLK